MTQLSVHSPEQLKNYCIQQEHFMVHYQHEGPIGQYHVPQNLRFKRIPGKTKVGDIVSTDPDIEVVQTKTGGREQRNKTVLLKIDGDYYSLYGEPDEQFDETGQQILRYDDGRAKVADLVWNNVRLRDWFNPRGIDPLPYNIVDARLLGQGDRLTDIIFEYLVTDIFTSNHPKVHRIIFDGCEPITPKNWEVIENG